MNLRFMSCQTTNATETKVRNDTLIVWYESLASILVWKTHGQVKGILASTQISTSNCIVMSDKLLTAH